MLKRGLVLGGGGSRGAYEIGVWRAARELGIHFDVVTGTSIGALNGALVVQGDYDFAVEMWKNMNYEAVMTNVKAEDFTTVDGTRRAFRTALREIAREGGMEIGPLEELVRSRLDEEKIRRSPEEFGIVTVEIPGLKAVAMSKEDIPEGEMADYLLASAACYPAFKTKTIGEKNYVDGGYRDNLPVDLAIELGANEVWAVDLQALGYVPEKLMYDVPVRYIRCYWDLGLFITFSPERIHRNMELGYLDTMKSLGYLDGFAYTFQDGEADRQAARLLAGNEELIRRITARENPLLAPTAAALELRLAMALKWGKRRKNSARVNLIREAELAAELLDMDPARVYTFQEFDEEIIRRFTGIRPLRPDEAEQALTVARNNPSAVPELLGKLGLMTGQEKLQMAVRMLSGCFGGRYSLVLLQAVGAALSREMAAALYLYLLGCRCPEDLEEQTLYGEAAPVE